MFCLYNALLGAAALFLRSHPGCQGGQRLSRSVPSRFRMRIEGSNVVVVVVVVVAVGIGQFPHDSVCVQKVCLRGASKEMRMLIISTVVYFNVFNVEIKGQFPYDSVRV